MFGVGMGGVVFWVDGVVGMVDCGGGDCVCGDGDELVVFGVFVGDVVGCRCVGVERLVGVVGVVVVCWLGGVGWCDCVGVGGGDGNVVVGDGGVIW